MPEKATHACSFPQWLGDTAGHSQPRGHPRAGQGAVTRHSRAASG